MAYAGFLRQHLTPALLAIGVLSQLHTLSAAWILPLWACAGIVWSLSSQASLASHAQRRLDLAVLLWLVLWLISCLLSLNVAHSFQLSVPTLLFAIAYVLLSRADTNSARSALLWSLAAVASWQSLSLCVSSVTELSPQARITALQTPLLLVPNDCVWMLSLWPLWWSDAQTRGRASRILCYACFTLHFAAMLSVQSRLCVAIALLLALCAALSRYQSIFDSWFPKRTRTVTTSALIVCMALLIGVALMLFGKGNASLNSRLQLAQTAWNLWWQNPWFGVGPHGFALHYLDALPGTRIDLRNTPWPHQLPLELLANTGLFATLSFAWLLWVRVQPWIAKRTHQPEQLSFIAFGMASFFEASTLRVWWWILLMLLISDVRSHHSVTFVPRQ